MHLAGVEAIGLICAETPRWFRPKRTKPSLFFPHVSLGSMLAMPSHERPQPLPEGSPQLVRFPQLCRILSISTSTGRRLRDTDPDFPRARQLSKRIAVYELSEIVAYLRRRL